MSEIYFEVEDDMVVKHKPMPVIGDYEIEVIMTKEIFQECYKKWIEQIEQQKCVQPIRPTGKWEQTRYRSIDQTGESYDDGIGFRCSNCANVFKVTSLARYNFCPNCGAGMRGE